MDFKTIFLDYFQKCLNEVSGIEIATLRDIAFSNAASANAALKELMLEGIVTSIPVVDVDKINMPISECNKFKLTEKGIDFIKQRTAGYEQKNKFLYTDAYLSAYKKILQNLPHEAIKTAQAMSEMQDIVKSFQPAIEQYKSILSSIQWETINSAKALQDLQAHMPTFDASTLDMRSSFTAEQIRQIADTYASIGDIVKSQYSGKSKKALSSFLDDVDKAQKEITGSDKVAQIETTTSDEENTKTFTFEGILGQNCGNVVATSSGDEKRIQVKGFKVNDGIRVLRGFAKASELAAISQADENYQRDKYPEHVAALSDFIQNIKTSAKYLPEVTLVARGYKKLNRITLSGQLSPTQQGELDNLEYFRLTVNEKQLYRVDGNHRLEALQDSDYYIPFAIIIWEESKVNQDDEAFLFYFLNAKAQKLTSEENLKGLVIAETWSEEELKTANAILPYIKYFREHFEENVLFDKKHYQNSQGSDNAKTQILNVLELILKEFDNKSLPFDKETFGNYVVSMQEILSQRDRFKYLRANFRCFPQFVFYTLYKNKGDSESSIKFIDRVDKWAEYYKHDSNSLIQPNKMFHNAFKQLAREINIFVAMPYYDDVTVAQFNKTFESLIGEINAENEIFEGKVNLYPIMTYTAESTDILANMDRQIGKCDIFIADISNHGKSKVNPNVMFEFGRVYDSKKFILIRNKDNKVTNSAFDIQHIDYVPIDFGMGFDTSIKSHLKPRIVNILKSIIGFC